MYIKSKQLAVPIGPEVAAFAAAIEAKLHIEGFGTVAKWGTIPIPELKRQLAAKVTKLLQGDDDDGLFMKAVVIGSIAMMLAEQASRKNRVKREGVRTKRRRLAVAQAGARTEHEVLVLDP